LVTLAAIATNLLSSRNKIAPQLQHRPTINMTKNPIPAKIKF
jgi:hypothetical protein